MVWGCFSASGVGYLHFLPPNSTMRKGNYRLMLNKVLLDELQRANCNIFMHDKAPAHTAAAVSEWLSKNQIKVLPWPGNSPDLNPIENLWKLIKDRVAAKKSQSLASLTINIQAVWNEFPVNYCVNLVSSIPKRIAGIIANNGYHCKY
ncbi:Transposable element Tcb1 transposase [Trichoplax sp. H2]|nr:Transposable element Tcb1 transposase [Trichoplax sp. H2]|eukprot:RDD37107.1 Transposable element Tcb1 transposase [Trichoplax sp. H2]